MAQYLLAVHAVEGTPPPTPEQMNEMFASVDVFNKELQEKGSWVFAGGLLPPNIATVVRNDSGKVTTSDGPFAETKEHIGGFWIVEAADLDAAHRWAAKASAACNAPVEVRQFQEIPG